VVGLGNPGPGYARHRHNVGFDAVDAIASHHHAAAFSKKFHGLAARCTLGAHDVLLLKPETFMNLSGKAVQAAMTFHKIPPENVIVLHDDLDLTLGKLRIKQGGGHGGHNGLRDIDTCIGKNYWRLRLGIGHPGDKNLVHSYVLSNFSDAERLVIQPMLTALATHIALFFDHSPQGLMSKLALSEQPAQIRT
jgi:peptidyl-tRNA hydrolase, PTH1 family